MGPLTPLLLLGLVQFQVYGKLQRYGPVIAWTGSRSVLTREGATEPGIGWARMGGGGGGRGARIGPGQRQLHGKRSNSECPECVNEWGGQANLARKWGGGGGWGSAVAINLWNAPTHADCSCFAPVRAELFTSKAD